MFSREFLMIKLIRKLVSHCSQVEKHQIQSLSFDAKTVIFAFYGLVFVIFQTEYLAKVGWGVHAQSWLGLLRVMSFLPPQSFSLDGAMAWLFASLLLVFLFPYWRIFRVSVFLSLVAVMGILYSFGKVDNDNDIIYAIAFAFMFFSTSQKTNKKVLLLAQALVFTNYFAAGVWKIIGLSRIDWSEPLYHISQIIPVFIAHTIIEGRTLTATQQIIMDYPWLSFLMWLSVMVIEAGSFLPMVSNWAWRHWWKLLMLFHLGTLWVMEIDFHPTPLFLLFIFVIAPRLGGEQVLSSQGNIKSPLKRRGS